jgi:formamidopyrimidine-DNA glycosylase
MPELPEVETVARGLRKHAVGHTIAKVILHRGSLRFPFPIHFTTAVTGQTITKITRASKYILMKLKDGGQILLHLGMSGRLFFHEDSYTPAKHDHVQFYLDNGSCLIFNDARRFGVMDYLEPGQKTHKLLETLGIDPLSANLTPEFLGDAFQKRKITMKAALMDQRIIAGLGNIYVCEALFRSKIWPERLTNTLTKAEAKKLAPAIVTVLNAAIDAGGSSLRDYVQTDGEMGFFQDKHDVYGREGQPCKKCRTDILRFTQNGRSTFACPHCQK